MRDLLELLLPFFVIAPVLMSVFLYVASSVQASRWAAIIAQGLAIIPAFMLLLTAYEAPVIVNVGGYDALLGIVLRADSMAALFVLLTSVIFFAVGAFTMHGQLQAENKLFMFLFYLLQGALMGLFLTRDFFNVFVLVEVATVVLTIMLMYDRGKRNLYAGMIFIMVNIVVMQFYLFGLGYLYMVLGVLDMEAARIAVYYADDAALHLPFALIMTSIASKMSLLPMLTWLPKIRALTGARFTIAALMSALHIKSGIYMFIRVQDVFGWVATDFFLVVGIVTAVAGVVLALAQRDIRLMLAYSTIAQVGLITVGLVLGGPYSHDGAVFHIINHALFKAALFMCASQICYIYGTTDITKMRGLIKASPVLAAANAIAVAGIIGAPLINGSISKYFLSAGAPLHMEWIINVINLGTILVFCKYCAMFTGADTHRADRKPDGLRVGVGILLGAACIALGVGGVYAFRFLFDVGAAFSVAGYLQKTAVWAGSVVVGIVLYRYVIVNNRALAAIKKWDASFSAIIVSIGVFFALLMVHVTGLVW
jgi:multicomponent Na+:H+ antiporter subunit D